MSHRDRKLLLSQTIATRTTHQESQVRWSKIAKNKTTWKIKRMAKLTKTRWETLLRRFLFELPMKLSNNSSRSDKYYKNTFSPLRLMATSTSYLAQKVCLKVVETLVLMIWLRKRCVTCLRFWASLSSTGLFWCRSCFKSWKTLVFTTTVKIRWASNNSSSSTIRTKSLLRGVHLSRIQKLQNRRRARSKKNNLTCLGSIRNQ